MATIIDKYTFWMFILIKSTLGNIFIKVKKSARAVPLSHKIKTNLTTLLSPILTHPQESQGCQKMPQYPLNINLEVWCAKIELKLNNLWKTVQKHGFFHNFFQFWRFFKDSFNFQIWTNLCAPNIQIWVQWMLAHHLTLVELLRARQ